MNPQTKYLRIIIIASTIVFLILGMAVVMLEYNFSFGNLISEVSAATIALLSGLLVFLVFVYLLNKKFNFFGDQNKKN